MAGHTHIPNLIDEFEIIPDNKWCQKNVTEEDILPTSQASLCALQDQDIDIRPRFWDSLSKQWILLDTGAQVSVTMPGPHDQVDPSVILETVDGSRMPYYGKKQFSFQLGRKQYHQELKVTNTTETILGMDFIKANKIPFFSYSDEPLKNNNTSSPLAKSFCSL